MGERLRWKNCDDVDRYLEAIREDRLPLAEAEILSEEEVWEERVLLALRTSEGVDRCVLGENTDMDKLEEDIVLFEELGLVWSGEEKLGFTEKGMMVSDALLYRLMAG
jgi:coproporphyrinogen III oxidase-like Fe-S oxidoreductase